MFETSDFGEVAVLQLHGILPVTIIPRGYKTLFVFEDSVFLREVLTGHRMGINRVPSRQYVDTYKALVTAHRAKAGQEPR